jgi:N-acetylglucosamine-6-sulfatase
MRGLTTAVFVLFFPACGAFAAVPPRPNIVVVLVDDLRWDEIGCAGHPFVRTPHIDRLAREGARFRNAFCTTPLCSPVRASLLTGQYVDLEGMDELYDLKNDPYEMANIITDPRWQRTLEQLKAELAGLQAIGFRR